MMKRKWNKLMAWPNKKTLPHALWLARKSAFSSCTSYPHMVELACCWSALTYSFNYLFIFSPLQRNLDKLLSEKFCSPTITYLEDKGKFLFSDVYALIWWDRNLIPLIVCEFNHNANKTTLVGSDIDSHLRNLFSNVLS